MKRLSRLFAVLTLLLSHTMCAVVAYNYGYLLHGAHVGTSAPAYVAFFYAIPFLALIAICLALYVLFRKKSRE